MRRCTDVVALVLAAFGEISAGTLALAESSGRATNGKPPVSCNPGRFISRVQCDGPFCDNVTVACQDMPNAKVGDTLWTDYFSEEQGFQQCPSGYFIAGLTCDGDRCDNVSLYCAQVMNATTSNCGVGNRFSEEGADQGLNFSEFTGKFAIGMFCFGDRCDDLQILTCSATAGH